MSKKKDGVNATVQDMQWLNDQQLQRLAEDKVNRVFAHTYEKIDKTWTADEKRDLIRDIRARYEVLRKEQPEAADDKLRTIICSEKYKWREFAKTYGSTFAYTTDRSTDEEGMKHQYYVLYVSKQLEMGQITPEQMKAMLSEYGKKITTRPKGTGKKG